MKLDFLAIELNICGVLYSGCVYLTKSCNLNSLFDINNRGF